MLFQRIMRSVIVAATVLCGELSPGSAIVAEEWVKAHDLLGRNRP
jgi:hydroxymethylglutaryl-CoA reductase (NADPH)